MELCWHNLLCFSGSEAKQGANGTAEIIDPCTPIIITVHCRRSSQQQHVEAITGSRQDAIVWWIAGNTAACSHAVSDRTPFPKVCSHAAEEQVEELFCTLSNVLWASGVPINSLALHVWLRNYQLVLKKRHFNRPPLVSVTWTAFSDSSAASGRRLNDFWFKTKNGGLFSMLSNRTSPWFFQDMY